MSLPARCLPALRLGASPPTGAALSWGRAGRAPYTFAFFAELFCHANPLTRSARS